MPGGDRTGPAGMGPIIGRAGFYGAGISAVGPYGTGTYGYGMPYAGRGNVWLRGGFGFGRGRDRGRGRGRGRLGYW